MNSVANSGAGIKNISLIPFFIVSLLLIQRQLSLHNIFLIVSKGNVYINYILLQSAKCQHSNNNS